MKLSKVSIRRFKRFSETEIADIPETARLVVIAGPNGSGKSSFFEALNVWQRTYHRGLSWDPSYYIKSPEQGHINQQEAVKVEFHEGQPLDIRKSIYIRSAYRNDPQFQISSINVLQSALDENRLNTLIENDAAVGLNYQRLAAQALEDVFERETGKTTIEEFREKVIGDIARATSRLFPDLKMNGLGNPLTEGTFRFDKGTTKSFLYKNLSGGEKAAFDLLLDLIVKKREFDDTIFCIDEPEAHMNSRLQGRLLEELYDTIGGNSQLWLSTHSVGMMRKARDLAKMHPGTVVFLDFGGRDFDQKQVVTPEQPTRAFWHRVLDVALDDFAELVAPKQVILCEGSRIGANGPSSGVDAKIYDQIFGAEYPDTRFIPAGNSHEVESDRLSLIEALQALVSGTGIRRLVDRDDLSQTEIDERMASGIRVLNRRNLESYLFDDQIIRMLAIKHGHAEMADQLISEKALEMEKAHAGRGRPTDDVKASSGPIMNSLKKNLSLTQCGGNVKEFMRITLSPLVTPGTDAYRDLEESIFVDK